MGVGILHLGKSIHLAIPIVIRSNAQLSNEPGLILFCIMNLYFTFSCMNFLEYLSA